MGTLTHDGKIAVPYVYPKTWRSRGRKKRKQPAAGLRDRRAEEAPEHEVRGHLLDDITPEEYRRRGHLADELFREVVRQASNRD